MEIVDENLNATYEFHCFISDDSRYDTSTTHTHMISILQQLKNGTKLKDKCFI